MLLTLTLPRIAESMTTAIIKAIYPMEGEALKLGAKLLDLSVDLSAVAPHDCPPISFYRFAARDRVWLRRLAVAPGDEVAVGTVLADFTTTPDEPVVEPAVRALRVTIAGIIPPNEWWSSDRP